jgi:hypothetical protein
MFGSFCVSAYQTHLCTTIQLEMKLIHTEAAEHVFYCTVLPQISLAIAHVTILRSLCEVMRVTGIIL